MHFHCGLGMAVAEWITCCATNREVACSIAYGFSEFFTDIKTSDRTVTLGMTLPLTDMSTRNISWWWSRTDVRLTTYHRPVPLSLNLGPLTSWNTLGHSRHVTGLIYLYFYGLSACQPRNWYWRSSLALCNWKWIFKYRSEICEVPLRPRNEWGSQMLPVNKEEWIRRSRSDL